LEFFFFYHSSGVSRMIWSVFIRLMPGRIVTRRALRVAEDEWKMRQYIALIHKEANSDYGISFPDLPGVISAGKTLDEARDMGQRPWLCIWKGWWPMARPRQNRALWKRL
jgi:hypothetical protein